MNIFSYWDQGRQNAPWIVQQCFQRWEDLNPGCSVNVFERKDLAVILSDLPFDVSLLPVQAQADILRVRLVRQHGGIWTDATVLPMLPLDRWFEQYIGPAGFFVYCASAVHWRFSNFLIMSKPGNHFIDALDERIKQYWTHPRSMFEVYFGKLQPNSPMGKRLLLKSLTRKDMGLAYVKYFKNWRKDLLYPISGHGAATRFYPYFWEQYLMMDLVRTDPQAADIVSRMPYRLHEHCHMLQTTRNTLGDDFERAIPMALLSAPIQKLDWRVEWPKQILDLPDPDRVLV